VRYFQETGQREYRVLTEPSIYQLEKTVNHALYDGFRLSGTLFFTQQTGGPFGSKFNPKIETWVCQVVYK